MEEDYSGMQKGSKVWCRTDEQTWTAAVVLSINDKETTIELDNGKQLTVPLKKTANANPEIQNGIQDLTQLSHLNEPSILYDLQFRYTGDQIYTNAGPVLIAVNPCKQLPLYTPETANLYKCEWPAQE
jgi:myosin-5